MEKELIMKMLKLVVVTFLISAVISINAKTKELSTLNSMPDVEFVSNPMHGLYNFVQGIAGGPGGTSRSLTEIFEQSEYNNKQYKDQIERFRQVNLSYNYAFSEEVPHRHNKRQITQLLVMASSQATTIDDFAQRIMGLLTNADLMVVIETLKAYEPIYQELVWKPAQERFKKDLVKLNQRAKEVGFASKFIKASNFYNANWKADLPFKVYLAPIPAESGFTTATPQGNIISYISTYIQDPDGVLAVVFHELAHLLYANQPIEFQDKMEKAFLEHDSYHKAHAYQLLNESLATAIGNGWFYKESKGQLDERDWYHFRFINQQAKSIYPLVESYLKEGKTIDNDFVEKYIQQYAENFPEGYLEPDNFLTNVSFLADKEFKEHNKLFQIFFQHQQTVRSLHLQTPFFDDEAMSKFNGAINAKVILITEEHLENFEKFADYYPGLKQVDLPAGEYVLHSLLPDGTMLMIVSISNLNSLGKAIEAIKKKKVLDEYIRVIKI